uniref:Uncharacterized protein n=1 Tax=Acrobeloides nanus TaxID=290746 RepID=A0A914CJC5_9BILA
MLSQCELGDTDIIIIGGVAGDVD